jgi:hypothetical protein
VVRVIKRKAKRDRFSRPSRYSVAVSTTPKNRFASEWLDVQAKGADGQLGHYLASKVDHPVGVIWMQNSSAAPLKSWLPFEALAEAPSLAEDYRILGAGYPGSPSYNANLRRYIKDWKAYWSDYIPEMIETKRVPDGLAWGTYPVQASKNESSVATQSYNVMAHSFTPATLKGVLYFAGEEVVSDAHFAEQKPVLQSSWRERFGGDVAVHVIPAANDVKSVAESIDQAGK